jgi:hypothetical protein
MQLKKIDLEVIHVARIANGIVQVGIREKRLEQTNPIIPGDTEPDAVHLGKQITTIFRNIPMMGMMEQGPMAQHHFNLTAEEYAEFPVKIGHMLTVIFSLDQ